jgi:hypothetical protein
MSNSYINRLQWVKPDLPDSGALTLDDVTQPAGGDNAAGKRARGMSLVEHSLRTVGLPMGSTEEARSSPLLEARDLLRAAAEIEHGLLIQYLYAAYSCAKNQFRSTITQIAREEMGHLISVQNFLLSVGGHPYFGRDDFPTMIQPGEVFPFALTFEPLSLDSLAKYVVAESPPLENIDDDDPLKTRVAPIIDIGKGAAHQVINHVGALYIALYWLFKKDDTPPTDAEWQHYPTDMVLSIYRQHKRPNWHVPDDAFVPQADLDDLQGDNDKEDWNRGDDRIIISTVRFDGTGKVDRRSILEPLAKIAKQGEGWLQSTSTDADKSHFIRFLETFEALQTIQDSDSPLPIVPVPTNPITFAPAPPDPAPDGFIDNAEANLWAQIFNVRYKIVLLKLTLVIASRRSLDHQTPDGREALISNTLEEMKTNLKKLALALIQMRRTGVPADGPQPNRAGPPFELPKGSLPDLVDLDPNPKVAADMALIALRTALISAIGETESLVNKVNDLSPNLLDTPAPRNVLADIVAADQTLLKALNEITD